MRYISSGHSHGKQITVILEGIPSNLSIDLAKINQALKLRQFGYGRGQRMRIENDEVEFLSGVLYGKTTGAPIAIAIKNNDYQNHKKYMDPFNYSEVNKIQVPRPGHADLVGALKYNQDDMRFIFERASARETVSRVTVGAICEQILNQIGIEAISYVTNIGGITISDFDLNYIEASLVRMPCKKASAEVVNLIEKTQTEKDTLGGTILVEVRNVPPGIGSYVSHETKLDAKIAQAVLSIQACKGVEFGLGFDLANKLGSQVHDEISYQNGFMRKTNNYGGFEGGMTTGSPIIIKAVFKPIPTLMRPLESVNIKTKEISPSHIERSDVCVIPAASIISKYTVIFEITKAIIEQFTSDSMNQLIAAVNNYREYLMRFYDEKNND